MKTGFNANIIVTDSGNNIDFIHPSQINDGHDYKCVTFNVKNKSFENVPFGNVRKIDYDSEIYECKSNKFKPSFYIGNGKDLFTYNLLNSTRSKYDVFENKTIDEIKNLFKITFIRFSNIKNIFEQSKLFSNPDYNKIETGYYISDYIYNKVKAEEIETKLASKFNITGSKIKEVEDDFNNHVEHDLIKPFISNDKYNSIQIPNEIITIPNFMLGFLFGFFEECGFTEEQDKSGRTVYLLKYYLPKHLSKLAEQYSKILTLCYNLKPIVKTYTEYGIDRKNKRYPIYKKYISLRINDTIMSLLKLASEHNMCADIYNDILNFIELNKISDPQIEEKVVFNPKIYQFKDYELILNKHIQFNETSDEISLYTIDGIDNVVLENGIVINC